jgi:N6-L-threonylcarbamoyladenine synthase
MLVLGIESTCDETACALVKDGKEILANIVSSQAEMHLVYGGVVPELSCRSHVETLIPTLDLALKKAGLQLSDIDLIAVAYAPGLVGALLLGLNTAKTLSLALNIPFVGVNHVEGHLYAAIMSHEEEPRFPCLGVVLSGGHTALWKVGAVGEYQLLGQTIDDAIGEAFDKVAKMLGLPYPGGPAVEELALAGKPIIPLRPGKIKDKPLDFSFSGLKTGVLYSIRKPGEEVKILSDEQRADVAASFQEAALNDVVSKVILAAQEHDLKDVILGGGVVNNKRLRVILQQKAPHLKCFWPSPEMSLDNAAMIAGLGYHVFRRKGNTGDSFTLQCQTRLPITGG